MLRPPIALTKRKRSVSISSTSFVRKNFSSISEKKEQDLTLEYQQR